MLKIYHTPPSRSVRIVWLAEEMGLPYEVVAVPFGGGPAPEGFREASPLGQLPAIEDGDVRMIESIAIMQYLLAKHGPTPLAVGAGEKDLAAYLQFLVFGEAGLLSIANALVATRFRAPEEHKQNWTVNYVAEELRRRLGVVEARLAGGREYVAADRFTAADISVCYGVGILKYFGIAAELAPALQAYLDRLTSRPAYKRASGG